MQRRWLSLFALVACNQSDFGPPPIGSDLPPGPGSPTWANTDLSCSTNDDCAPGEVCDGGFCRPKQCDDGPYISHAPLGGHHLLFPDDELLVIDGSQNQGSYWVDGYGAAGSIDYHGAGGGSYSLGTSSLVDVARIDTPAGAGMIVAISGKTDVTITGAAIQTSTVNVGIVPIAVAAGDVDGDQVDDVIALDASGKIAICKQDGSGCNTYSTSGISGVDLAAADVDGDGLAEVIILGGNSGGSQVIAWSVDDGTTIAANISDTYMALTAGDVDHDGRAEVALLRDGGWLGLRSDHIDLFRVGSQWDGVASYSTISSSIDIAAGDLDASDTGDAIVVLGDDGSVDVQRWDGQGLSSSFSGSAGTTSSPKRVALADVDGDSVAATLVSGPDLIAGNLAPMIAVTFPPYDATVSKGGTSGVAIGNRTNESTDATSTVSLTAGVEVGVGADFLSIFSAHLSETLSRTVTQSKTLSKSYSVGTTFSLKPQTDLYGDHYGAVVVGSTCFHSYVYQLVDPANHDGGTGHEITMVVPVGGQTTVLSTPRYGALAQHAPGLPSIVPAAQIGNPQSYPTAPTKLDGSAVQPDEQVFPQLPTLSASDVSTVAFSLSVGSSQTNTSSLSTSLSLSGSLGALGVTFGASLGASWGQSYAVTIGSASEFSGDIPPIADDPNTPEDEYRTHGYSFAPYVYRETFTDPASQAQAGYYAIQYAVSR